MVEVLTRNIWNSFQKNYDIKVNFLGNIPHSDLIKTYKKYKYFLSTSKFEGNPKNYSRSNKQ